MRVYETDHPYGMIYEALQGQGKFAVEEAIWILEEAHDEAKDCIADCERRARELRAGKTDWFERIVEEVCRDEEEDAYEQAPAP